MDKIEEQKFQNDITKAKRVFAKEEVRIYQTLKTEFLVDENMPVLHYGSIQLDHSSTVVKIIEDTYKKITPSILKSNATIDGMQVIINKALKSLKDLKTKLEDEKYRTSPLKLQTLKKEVNTNILGDLKTPPHASLVLEQCNNELAEMIKSLIKLGIDQVEKLNHSKVSDLIMQIRDNIKIMQSLIDSDSQNAVRSYSISSSDLVKLQGDLMKLQFKNKIASWTPVPSQPEAKIDPDLQKYKLNLDAAKKTLDAEQKIIDTETQKLEYWSHWHKNESEINSRISDLKGKGKIMGARLDNLIDELNEYKTSGKAIETNLKALVKKKDELRYKLKEPISKMVAFFDPKGKKIDEGIAKDFGALSKILTILSEQLKNLDFDDEFIQDSTDSIVTKTDYLSYKVLTPFKTAFGKSEFNSTLLDKLVVSSDYNPALEKNETLDKLREKIVDLKEAMKATQEEYDKALNRFNRRKEFQL